MTIRATRLFAALLALAALLLPVAAPAQERKGDDLPLSVAQGVVEKADKDALTVQPRGAGGKFGKSLTLRLTGTSRVTLLSPQTRDGKVVPAQRDVEAKELQPGQAVAVIYTEAKKGDLVLLSAVAQPAPAK
jgi:hypothetical protein